MKTVLQIGKHLSAEKLTSSEEGIFVNWKSMTAWLPSNTSSVFVALSEKVHLTKDTAV
jgi:hypothetical protein